MNDSISAVVEALLAASVMPSSACKDVGSCISVVRPLERGRISKCNDNRSGAN